MTSVRTTATAEQELDDILLFIAADSPAHAIRFVDALQERVFDTLADFPESGVEYVNGTRYLVLSGYTLVYDFNPQSDIVYILHYFAPGMDWKV